MDAQRSPYSLLLEAALLIPFSHYILLLSFVLLLFIYILLEIHLLQDLSTAFRGRRVKLTFHPSSKLYDDVVSRCTILHGRYMSTPWLCSPHLQTMFMHLLWDPPKVSYETQLFLTLDGGTIAMDWVSNGDDNGSSCDENSPIVIVIPGLSNASNSSYVKHLSWKMSISGYKVVVCNHRGLGGVPITSDILYNAGRTDDLRSIVGHLRCKYPKAPLFAIGTSIGANILIKYLGEDGKDVPLNGAAAICSTWDNLLCDRFLRRRFMQRLYDKAITKEAKDYANMHKDVLSRLTNWQGVEKARSCRDFDDAATRVLANCDTVDAYYRQVGSYNYVGRVTIPLLCISSLDDPICTSEAIPWDECRLNKNVVLATTEHGGHLPFFEGLKGDSLWWVRAVEEFFTILSGSLGKKDI